MILQASSLIHASTSTSKSWTHPAGATHISVILASLCAFLTYFPLQSIHNATQRQVDRATSTPPNVSSYQRSPTLNDRWLIFSGQQLQASANRQHPAWFMLCSQLCSVYWRADIRTRTRTRCCARRFLLLVIFSRRVSIEAHALFLGITLLHSAIRVGALQLLITAFGSCSLCMHVSF